MSVEKTQFLLSAMDEVRLFAEKKAEQLGIPDRYHQMIHIPRPVKREELLMLAACSLAQERPGLMLPILNVMPEPPDGAVPRTATHMREDVREKKAKKKAKDPDDGTTQAT